MAQLSIIPGRFRLESRQLVGCPEVCSGLDRRLTELIGVREASCNPRTGRILVRFDGGAVNGEELIRRIEELLSGLDRGIAVFAQPPLRSRKDGAGTGLPSQVVRHLLWDAMAHALLPGPIGILLPAAMAAFRR